MVSQMVKDQEFRRHRPSPTAEDWDLNARFSTMTAEERRNNIDEVGASAAYKNLFPSDLSSNASNSGNESDKDEEGLPIRQKLSRPAFENSPRESEQCEMPTSSTRSNKSNTGRSSGQQTCRQKSLRRGTFRSPNDNDRSRSRSGSRGILILSSRSSSSSVDARPTQPTNGHASTQGGLNATDQLVTTGPVGPYCANLSPLRSANAEPCVSLVHAKTPASSETIESTGSQILSAEIQAAIASLLRPTVFSPSPYQSTSDSVEAPEIYCQARDSETSYHQISIHQEMTKMVYSVFDGPKTPEKSASPPPCGSNMTNNTALETVVPAMNALASNVPIILPDDLPSSTIDQSSTVRQARYEGNQGSGTTAAEKLSCTQLEKLMQENRVKWEESRSNISELKDVLRRLDLDYDEMERQWATQNQKERAVGGLGNKFGHLTKYVDESNKRMLVMEELTNKAKTRLLVPEDVQAALKMFSVDLEEVGMQLSLTKPSGLKSTWAPPLIHRPASLSIAPPSFLPSSQSAVTPATQSVTQTGTLSLAILPGFSLAVMSSPASLGSLPALTTTASPLSNSAILSVSVPLKPPDVVGMPTDSETLHNVAKRTSSIVTADKAIEAKESAETSGRSSSLSSHKKHKKKHSRRHRRHKHNKHSKQNVEDTPLNVKIQDEAKKVSSGSSSSRKKSSQSHSGHPVNDNETTGNVDP